MACVPSHLRATRCGGLPSRCTSAQERWGGVAGIVGKWRHAARHHRGASRRAKRVLPRTACLLSVAARGRLRALTRGFKIWRRRQKDDRTFATSLACDGQRKTSASSEQRAKNSEIKQQAGGMHSASPRITHHQHAALRATATRAMLRAASHLHCAPHASASLRHLCARCCIMVLAYVIASLTCRRINSYNAQHLAKQTVTF